MLEGLEISILNFSDIIASHKDVRYDSEFYLKRFIETEKRLSTTNRKSISECAEIFGGNAYKSDAFGEEGIKIATITDINQNTNIENWNTISFQEYSKFSKNLLKYNDILLGGTHHNYWDLGKVIIIKNTDNYSKTFNQRTFNIRFKSILPEYGFITLKTINVRNQIERLGRGNNQLNLSGFDLGNIEIPILPTYTQAIIKSIVDKSFLFKLQSKKAYTQAENLLLEEIGLQNFTPSQEPVNVKSFKDSFATSGRLDAEYYQKKYDEIERKVESIGCYQLGNIFDLKTSSSPKKYLIEGIKVIKTKNVRIPSVNFDSITDYTDESKVLIENNDLLFASMGVGSLGRVSFINDNQGKATVDGTIKILRIKKECINQYFEIPTLLFLTSKIGQENIYKYVIGSTGIISISKENIQNLTIPKIEIEKRKKITNLVLESISLKKQSEHLLETAKKAVEIAIEQNEAKALEFIKQESPKDLKNSN